MAVTVMSHATDNAPRSTHQAGTIAHPDSRSQWNAALAALPAAHILQTWEWGAFKGRHGWQASRILWLEGDRPRAAASTLTRRLLFWPWPVMYVPKGPALDYTDSALLNYVLGGLESAAHEAGASFVKIDPDVRANTPLGDAVVATLRGRGWCASHQQIQFRNTILIDLTCQPDQILGAMKSKWRYNVRLASRKGVEVREGGRTDLNLLYEMYAETASRNGFVIRRREYYLDAWGSLIEAGLAQPLIAEVDGEPVAMVLVFQFPPRPRRPDTSPRLTPRAGRAWYMYGASRPVHREKMPNHLLQWEAMLRAREGGCATYDMWGAPDVLDKSDPMWGVYRFKQGFGGEFVQRIGAWDFPILRPAYWLYSHIAPRVLKAMRWWYWQHEV
jgi:lipid II:glycine glycyltransferase (peptidoglycan interpeptide bridge formation enzyme)